MLAQPGTTRFDCPTCGAGYKLVRVEADLRSDNRQITCRKCGGPLQGRQGNMVLKYFLVDRPGAQARRERSTALSFGRH